MPNMIASKAMCDERQAEVFFFAPFALFCGKLLP
jgi:hypothetical protein